MNRMYFTGFTLIELVVTTAVLSILLAIAIPGFQSTVKENRIITETNRLVTDIQLARSEGLKRRARVILCRSADPTSATPSCGGTTNTWSSGWLVFVSGDTNGSYEAANDTLLRIGQPAGGEITIKTNGTSNNNLEFNPDATTNESGSVARFALCDERGESHGRQIEVPPTGRPRLAPSVVSCTTPV
jgi:type IV fimbrial biogenesis protein FimT